MRSVVFKLNKQLPHYLSGLIPIRREFSCTKISRVQKVANVAKEKMTQKLVGLPINTVIEKLSNIAPLSLAESWDNVGLLVEPSVPKLIKRIFLTNDLTEEVLDEALELKADFILAYHPPIFVALKSLTTRTWKERVIVKCIENRVAVFSPHTSYDSVHGGVNDWMASAFGVECIVAPLSEAKCHGIYSHLLEAVFPNSPAGNLAINDFQKKIQQYANGSGEAGFCDMKEQSIKIMKVSIPCTSTSLPEVVKIFNEVKINSEEVHLRITKYDEVPIPQCGTGRLCTLKQSLTVSEVVEAVKSLIKIPHLRLALVPGCDMNSLVSTIAICVGSGTSVLRGVKADLYLTGEMLHHDVLDAVHSGSHVILCNHSDSERGFLTCLASKLHEKCKGDVEIIISQKDSDPLNTV